MALQYGGALALSLFLFAALVEAQVERRVNRQAEFLLHLQLVGLLDDYQEQARTSGTEFAKRWLIRHATLLVESADSQIGLGVELLGPNTETLASFGSLVGHHLPVDRQLLDGEQKRVLRAANVGRHYAYLIATAPVEGGFLRVGVDTEQFADNVREIRQIFALSIPVVLLFSAGAGWFLSQRALRPISRINATAQRINTSTIETAIPTTGSGDELDQLAATLNEMMERIRSGVQRIERFSANTAHELRSPLNRMTRHTELLLSKELSPEVRGSVERVAEEVERMAREIESMLHLSRVEQGIPPERRTRVDLSELCAVVVEFFQPEAESRDVQLNSEIEGAFVVEGEETWLRQLVSNLLTNGIKYTPAGGRVTLVLEPRGDSVRLVVRDSGPGIPLDQRERIFERFERNTDSQESGFGLGLPIAQEIARAHGGLISVSSAPKGGSSFSLSLAIAP